MSSLSISSPHDPHTDQEQPSGSQCLCLEMVPSCQACIIQILCSSNLTHPWGGAVATPNAPVHCYKTSESGIPLSCWLQCFLCDLTVGHRLVHFLLFMYSEDPTGTPFPLVISFMESSKLLSQHCLSCFLCPRNIAAESPVCSVCLQLLVAKV